MDALERHFQMLEVLDVDQCGVKSWMIQEILTSCPNLVEFRGNRFDAFELVADRKAYESRRKAYRSPGNGEPTNLPMSSVPRPWVCTRLRVLSMGIVGVERDWQDQVSEILGQLKELQWADFGFYHQREGRTHE